jgi:hypothetical protein
MKRKSLGGGISAWATLFDETDSTNTIGCTPTILLMILSLGMICFIEGCFVILPLYVR